ncbi:MAG: alpha/beta hydrolase [Chloroflexota bacterium]
MAASRSNPSTTSLMRVNGRSLCVEISGVEDARTQNGPWVVLMHHGLGSLGAWRLQSPALVAAGWRVLAYDRWGYGRSDPRPALSLPTFADDVDDLRALLDLTGVRQAALVGHSDGGTLALYFAAQYPQRVTRLVSVAAHIYVEARMEPGIEGVRQAFESDPTFRRALERVHGEKARSVFYNWYDGWRQPENLDWDMRPLLSRVACPVLVVQGVEDEHATPQHARHLAQALPDGQLWLLPGAGHMLPQDQAQVFNPRLLDFLGRPGKAGSSAEQEVQPDERKSDV